MDEFQFKQEIYTECVRIMEKFPELFRGYRLQVSVIQGYYYSFASTRFGDLALTFSYDNLMNPSMSYTKLNPMHINSARHEMAHVAASLNEDGYLDFRCFPHGDEWLYYAELFETEINPRVIEERKYYYPR